MSEQIVMVEITGYDKISGQVKILRYCDGLAYRLRPTEMPANALYRPFVIDAGWYRVDVFSAPGQYGHVTPGEVVLDDSSGSLGAELINYAFDGRAITIRIGMRGAAYPSGMVTVISGTMDGPPTFDWNKIIFRPADLIAAQRKPLQSVRYAGTNVPPNGLEGVDDIDGNVKPMVLALASNMTPVLVNASKLIYQVSIPVGPQIISVGAVRDKGVPITAGAVYASIADLQDDMKAPAAGTYKVLSTLADGCFIRLGSKPAGAMTLDASYGSAMDRTHAQVWRRVLNYAGIPDAVISLTDVAALDAALSAEIEYAILTDTNIDTAASEIASSAGASWYGDPTGCYRISQWQAPAGPAVATLTALRTDTMAIADQVGSGDVAPAYRITLQYGRNWTPQGDSSLGGDKTSAGDTVRAPGGRAGLTARGWLATEYRTVPAEDLSIKIPHPNAIEVKMTSLIASQVLAQAFADSQLALYRIARHMTTLSQWLSPAQIDVIRPGSVVTVKQARWGYEAGRLMRVAGIKIDRETGKTEMNCWG